MRKFAAHTLVMAGLAAAATSGMGMVYGAARGFSESTRLKRDKTGEDIDMTPEKIARRALRNKRAAADGAYYPHGYNPASGPGFSGSERAARRREIGGKMLHKMTVARRIARKEQAALTAEYQAMGVIR